MGTHNLDPARVLQLVAALGGPSQRLILVGCEPETAVGDEDLPAGLSAPVREAVEEAVPLVESLLARLLGGGDAVPGEDNSVPVKENQTCHPQSQRV
jgi:hydrogenase maturation protease